MCKAYQAAFIRGDDTHTFAAAAGGSGMGVQRPMCVECGWPNSAVEMQG